ncbi:CBS domain-containing protein, partial [Candidatus Micrarchaeota archaeon]|nr:CBS domain-containing protein [Candidatus Micrarchaeota archaeon]
QLAKLGSVSQSLIAKVEAGKIDPSYSNAKNIFDVLESLEDSEQLKAKDVMSKEIIFIKKGETIAKAAEIMAKNKVSQLPILDGDKIVGSVSEQTISAKIAGGGDMKRISAYKVEDVMEESFPSVDEETPLSVLATLLRYNDAVLIMKRGKLGGIVSKADLLKTVQ